VISAKSSTMKARYTLNRISRNDRRRRYDRMKTMSDEPTGVLGSVLSAGKDSKSPLFVFALIISIIVAFMVFMAFPFIVMAIISNGRQIISGEKPVQSIWRNCYDFKEIKGQVFKVDQCSGKLERYNPEQKSK